MKNVVKLLLISLIVLSAGSLFAQYSEGVPWGPAPRLENPISPTVQEPVSMLLPNSRAFGYVAYQGTLGPSKFFLNTPQTIQNLSVQGSNFFAGGDWVPGNPGRWYAFTYTTRQILYCDTTTGVNTIVGTATVSGSPVGLAYDPASDTLFAITTAPNNLYWINRTTGAATLRAAITGVTQIIDGAFSNGGQLYCIELVGVGNLGKVNKYTGAWSTVGPLGVIPYYAQGSSFDRSDNLFYWASYTQPGPGILKRIDTNTAQTTTIGTFMNSSEVDGLAIPSSISAPSCNYVWNLQTSGVTTTLYSVKAVSNMVAWAAGVSAVVRRTIDGGQTWTNGNPNPGVIAGDVYNIFALDANNAWCTTSPSATNIYRTTNGGTNWILSYTAPSPAFINGIWMINATTGYATGDPVSGVWELLITTNGGANWSQMGSAPTAGSEAGWNNSFFVLGNNIWFGTNNTRVYASTNLGTNWGYGPTTGTVNTYGVWFNSPALGVACGTAAVKTTNGGVNWTATGTMPGTGNMTGCAGFDQNFWVTRGGVVYRSSDAGGTWAAAYTGTPTLWAINMTSVSGCAHGWAVGASGTIVRMINIVGVSNNKNEIPNVYNLEQNYPNPFNPTTMISFDIPKADNVKLVVYDVLGREVALLVNQFRQAGTYDVQFDGSTLSSGVYFYRLETGSFTQTKKMLLVK